MTPEWRPVTPDLLRDAIASYLAEASGLVRVAIDGPPCADPAALVASLTDRLRALSRPVVHIVASSFWRDASLRLEHGREDAESYLNWLDADAMRREVLVPVVARGEYLPSLRDPQTNRSTRELSRSVDPATVVIVSGEFLLGSGLPFDRVVHVAVSPAARARQTPPELAWTLPAFDEYDAIVDPIGQADVVVKLDDPDHPVVTGLPDP